jgi:hypothetical protein
MESLAEEIRGGKKAASLEYGLLNVNDARAFGMADLVCRDGISAVRKGS